jgi:hypothetical protein
MLLRALGDRIEGAALPPEVGEAAREMLGWLDENPEADPDGRGRGLAETALRELDALSEETTR